jgi:hypothetical protein
MSGNNNKRPRASSWDDEYLPNLPRPPFRGHSRPEPETWPETSESSSSRSASGLPSVEVIHIGHSKVDENTKDMHANCTVTLIRGCKFNILVDTMTAWDGQKLQGLLSQGLYTLIFLKPTKFKKKIFFHLS